VSPPNPLPEKLDVAASFKGPRSRAAGLVLKLGAAEPSGSEKSAQAAHEEGVGSGAESKKWHGAS